MKRHRCIFIVHKNPANDNDEEIYHRLYGLHKLIVRFADLLKYRAESRLQRDDRRRRRASRKSRRIRYIYTRVELLTANIFVNEGDPTADALLFLCLLTVVNLRIITLILDFTCNIRQ